MNKTNKILIVILILLVIGGAYYFAVYKPTEKETVSINDKIEKLEEDIKTEEVQATKLLAMKEEVETQKQKGSKVWDYDCAKEELRFLSQVISKALSYDISFEEPTTDDGIYVRRSVKISFKTDSYEKARSIIDEIIGCEYRTIFKDITVNQKNEDADGTSLFEINADIIFIEYCSDISSAKGLVDNRPSE